MNLENIHEDERGYICLVKDLLENGKEYTFMEIKKGYARGGCLHTNDENFVVIEGKVRYICGVEERILRTGDAGRIPANKPHAFIAIENSIVSEWGITSEEKKIDKKDPGLRGLVDRINSEARKSII